MTWEYLVVFLGVNRQGDLNNYGKNGWELVSIVFEGEDKINPTAYLKRKSTKAEQQFVNFIVPDKQVYDD